MSAQCRVSTILLMASTIVDVTFHAYLRDTLAKHLCNQLCKSPFRCTNKTGSVAGKKIMATIGGSEMLASSSARCSFYRLRVSTS
jgi:hypothetical protein